jgi:excisionase family DNA binding protein
VSPHKPSSQSWIDDVVSDLPRLLTLDEATKVLRVSRRNLSRWIVAGHLQAIKTGTAQTARVLIPRTAIVEYLRTREAA